MGGYYISRDLNTLEHEGIWHESVLVTILLLVIIDRDYDSDKHDLEHETLTRETETL
jgi:hypothetical protein